MLHFTVHSLSLSLSSLQYLENKTKPIQLLTMVDAGGTQNLYPSALESLASTPHYSIVSTYIISCISYYTLWMQSMCVYKSVYMLLSF